ncbi:hypothetical protein DPMN_120963 [Dreissena polymorpha]|uniref:Uncharacterized protein n=1 Tax=Dreissena polymorpha TaxID=45954 RepID=A0A9D4JQN7_DREPO|nr:hypothetical protein DPMN_120963 [Dreissena polymorpha]
MWACTCCFQCVGLVRQEEDAEQSLETPLFKDLYPAFCVRVKRPGIAAAQYDGDYEGFVKPVLGKEADGAACSQPAQSG